MSTNKASKSKVSIGIPVYNGEKFIRKRIDSILTQTFTDFELIISDNASTDSTSNICQEYARKDERIQYFRQKNNMGPIMNLNFVLQKATGEYFTWAAVDDLWEPTFLTKNIEILESDPNIVGSISEVDFFGKYADRYNSLYSPKMTKHRHVKPISGNYFEKAKLGLRANGTMIYGLFRTKSLQKSYPEEKDYRNELILILSILKYGNFHVVDELLMHRGADGFASGGRIHALRSVNISRFGILFQYLPLMKWSFKNLGLKFMLKNFPVFVRVFYVGYGRMLLDLVRSLKHN